MSRAPSRNTVPFEVRDDFLAALFEVQEGQGISNSQLAHLVHTTPTTIRHLRMGRMKCVIRPTIQRLARALGYEFRLVRIEEE